MGRLSAEKLQRLSAGLGEWPQRLDELQQFRELIRSEGVRSYLEIGISHGFTFRYIGTGLATGTRMTGVDHHGVWTPHLVQTMDILKEHGQDADIIWGDSKAVNTIENVRRRGPYDCVLIDGDHSHAGVGADWVNYSPMSRIVALHDINADRNKWDERRLRRFGVPKLYNELKQKYRHISIVSESAPGMGIGVLWMQ